LSIRKLLKYFDDLESEKRWKKRKKKKSGTLEQHRQDCRNDKEKGEKKKKRREKINSREKKKYFSRIESEFQIHPEQEEQLANISKNRKLKCEETVSQIEQTKERKKLKIPDSTVRHEEVIFFCYFYFYFLAKNNSKKNIFLP
jgi:hypothetical protein